MSDSRFWMVFAYMLVILAVTLVAIRLFERRRMGALQTAGKALGLIPFEKGAPVTMPSLPLTRKRGRRLGAALHGLWQGRPVLVFDLSYPAGKSVSVQTALVMRHDGLAVPEVAAIERHFNRYLPSMDLEQVMPRSSLLGRAYRLFSRSGTWPFGEECDRWLVEHRGRESLFRVGWSYEAARDGVLVYRRGRKAPPEDLRVWLDEATAVNIGFAAQAAGSLMAESAADVVPTRGLSATQDAFEAAKGNVRVHVTVKTTVRRRDEAR